MRGAGFCWPAGCSPGKLCVGSGFLPATLGAALLAPALAPFFSPRPVDGAPSSSSTENMLDDICREENRDQSREGNNSVRMEQQVQSTVSAKAASSEVRLKEVSPTPAPRTKSRTLTNVACACARDEWESMELQELPRALCSLAQVQSCGWSSCTVRAPIPSLPATVVLLFVCVVWCRTLPLLLRPLSSPCAEKLNSSKATFP
jgi:hypothetical protein